MFGHDWTQPHGGHHVFPVSPPMGFPVSYGVVPIMEQPFWDGSTMQHQAMQQQHDVYAGYAEEYETNLYDFGYAQEPAGQHYHQGYVAGTWVSEFGGGGAEAAPLDWAAGADHATSANARAAGREKKVLAIRAPPAVPPPEPPPPPTSPPSSAFNLRAAPGRTMEEQLMSRAMIEALAAQASLWVVVLNYRGIDSEQTVLTSAQLLAKHEHHQVGKWESTEVGSCEISSRDCCSTYHVR